MSETVHGALDYAELQRLDIHPDEIIDFSVNSNPYGPSPRVREALVRVPLDRYPDRDWLELCGAIREYELSLGLCDCKGRSKLRPYSNSPTVGAELAPPCIMPSILDTNVSYASIVCGNGSNELIWAIARAFLQNDSKAALIGPTYGEYRAASLATGAKLVEYCTQPEQHFVPNVADIAEWIVEQHPQLVWLCNPNNPTGGWLSLSDLLTLLHVCKEVGAYLVVDESYWHFLCPAEETHAPDIFALEPDAPLFVVRSLTKDYALAALRVGYVVTTPALARKIQAYLPAWNVNALAQAAAVAALADQEYLHATLTRLAQEREAFFAALRDVGLQVVPSRTHFCLVQVKDATSLRSRLLQRKLLVRDCTSFGLPEYIRVSTRPASDWQRLITALQELL